MVGEKTKRNSSVDVLAWEEEIKCIKIGPLLYE